MKEAHITIDSEDDLELYVNRYNTIAALHETRDMLRGFWKYPERCHNITTYELMDELYGTFNDIMIERGVDV